VQRRFFLVLAVILVLFGLGAVWLYSGERSGPTPLSIETAEGSVIVAREGSESPGTAGFELTPGDRVRTGSDGAAVLSRGGRAPIRMAGNTSLRLEAIDDDVVTMALEDGSVRARVRPDAGAVRLSAGKASVLATDAELALSTGASGIRLDVEDGSATVSGVPGVAVVGEGQRLNVLPDGGQELREIPEELLLDVAWPARGREEVVTVRGRTEPGAVVRVRGATESDPVRADAQGRFETEVSLEPGENLVALIVEDGFGVQTEREARLVRDKDAPTFELEFDYERPR
jgi:hypothetical protein